jgi:N-acetylneuraminic acid mutarotase
MKTKNEYIATMFYSTRIITVVTLLIYLNVLPASADTLKSLFLSNDVNAAQVIAGTPYNMNDTAWMVNVSDQNKNTFAYKLFSGLLMLGYQTEIAINYASYSTPHILALHAFQVNNGLPVSDLVSSDCMRLMDQQLVVREQELATAAHGFKLYDHMQPLHANDISKDVLAAIYSLSMKALPAYLQMSLYEELQCINGQCNGFIQQPDGSDFPYYPINLTDDYRFVGAYFDPLKNTPRKPSAAVHAQTVLHEYAHYLDGYYKVYNISPLTPKFKIIDTTDFYAIGYDLSTYGNGCYTPKSTDPKDWISRYAAQMPGYGNCSAGKAVLDEDWAESFSMYVASGRDFRAAATQSTYIAQKYNWIKEHVFFGLEYDTDLVRDTESGCNDVYLYGRTGVPGYAHCNNNYVWDFTLKPLASSINTIPTSPAQGSFVAQTNVNISTAAVSNTVTVKGINWPSTISISGGEYSVNGGSYVSAAGTVDNGDSLVVRQTSSDSYSTQTNALLTIGGVNSSFSITTWTPLQPNISGTPSSEATAGSAYYFTPVATNTSNFSLGGNIPPGFNFNTSTGTLSGITSVAGSYGPIVILAVNGNLSASLPEFSIEVLSPYGSFTKTGSMAIGRNQSEITPLSTGKILVTGGYDWLDMPLASAELYDPVTGVWSEAAPMLSPRTEHRMSLLSNGSVLVTGGHGADGSDLANAEVYDPIANTWVAVSPMKQARSSHTATLLANGTILVVGGSASYAPLATVEIYDPETNVWSVAAPLSVNRSYHTATLLQDGNVLVVAGYNGDWQGVNSVELYNSKLNSWSTAAPLHQARVINTANILPDGTVLVTGGFDNTYAPTSSVERYNSANNSWATVAPMSTQRAWNSAVVLNNGDLLVAGGQGVNGPLATAEVYSLSTGKWTVTAPMQNAQLIYGAALLANGKVLLASGNSDVMYAMPDAQLFNNGFATPTYTLTFVSSGNGSLRGVTTQVIAQGGTSTTVTAVPSSGYHFVNWIGIGGFYSATNPLVVSNVTAAQNITALFAVNDAVKPVVTTFAIPTTSKSATIAITIFSASDNVAVSGYLLTTTATEPLTSASDWSATKPTSFTFIGIPDGVAVAKTLYAWAKDGAGNVSLSRSAQTTVTLPDITRPVVSAFAIPTASKTAAVQISSLIASDNIAITGYLFSSTATIPLITATGWSTAKPTSYTFTGLTVGVPAVKTLYVWVKDAAGNISLPCSAQIIITVPDLLKPVVSAFAIPSTSKSATVAITTFTVNDNGVITGYLLTLTATVPLATNTGWSASKPTNYSFTGLKAGVNGKTIYAWAKDAAGNVSRSRSAKTTIMLP